MLHSLKAAADAPSEAHIQEHDGDAAGVDGRFVCVLRRQRSVPAARFNMLQLAKPYIAYLKELAHSVLRGLLQRGASEPGEAKAAGKVLADFPHETMEGSLADQEVRRPLVLSDFAQRDGAYAEPVRPSDWAKAANGSTAGPAASFSAVGHSLCVRAAAARLFMRGVLRCDGDAPRQRR
jgi:hypothetical protein